MVELERVSIKGFKSIHSVESLSLGPITVLIGANGSGKSNFINLFSFLREIMEGHLQQYVGRAGGADKILHFGSKVTNEIEIFLVFRNEVNQYRINLESTESDSLFPTSEIVYYWDKSRYPRPYNELLAGSRGEAAISADKDKLKSVAWYVRDHFERWRTYHFHDTSSGSALKKSAKLSDNKFLRADGSNLPAFLYRLKEKHAESYGLIRAAVRRVFSAFQDFDLEPDPLNSDFISLAWKHRQHDAYFDASSFSDGTLRFLALATLFLQPVELRPSIVIVDEPELGLHPYAIGVLAALIRQASVDTQVLISTQSPFLLDHFEPSEVIVSDLKDGQTCLSKLDSSGLEGWLQDYSLGQLWEKNEIGGRPAGGVK